MKKIVTVAAFFAAMALAFNAFGQNFNNSRLGVLVGGTSSSSNLKDAKTLSLYHAGVAVELPLGGGFHIQPAVLYQVKGMGLDKMPDASVTQITDSFETKVGYVEVPVQLQWGPDLMAFRPYVFAEPFAGYRLTSRNNGEAKKLENELKTVEYGLGVGAGIEIWRLQVSAKYFWNFGGIYKSDINKTAQTIKGLGEGNNFNGVAFSVGLFF